MTDLDAKEVAWVAQLAGSRDEVTAIGEDDAMTTSEVVEPEILDVETLADALMRVDAIDVGFTEHQRARLIADAYARLRSEPIAKTGERESEPCPYCSLPSQVKGAGCMECRGRGTVGLAFRRNRGLPPLPKDTPQGEET